MSIDAPSDLAGLRRAGAVVAETLRELRGRVRPGVTTGELDREAERIFQARGARSGPRLDDDFPGTICISVDAEAVHGIPGLTGHGIGRRIHEEPTVANVFDAAADEPLTPGLVITVEPIIAAGGGAVVGLPDGWTVGTADGSPVAHAEHTIVVTEERAIVLTA